MFKLEIAPYSVSPEHEIEIGDAARFEKALVDGDYFGRYYMCIPCLEKELDEYHNPYGESDE
jgi:hypothetical protein